MHCFLSFSGGLDSTTLLACLLDQGYKVHPVFFDYGSTHNQWELNSACRVFHFYQQKYGPELLADLCIVPLHKAEIWNPNSSALLQNSSMEIPDANYQQEGSLASTVVPGRNLIMASILAAKAEAHARVNGFDKTHTRVGVALATHAGDHALYPDCRPEFSRMLSEVIAESSSDCVVVHLPFINSSKEHIVSVGLALQVPYELTRSCYKAQHLSCGKCGTCQERLQAFAGCGHTDPVEYVRGV